MDHQTPAYFKSQHFRTPFLLLVFITTILALAACGESTPASAGKPTPPPRQQRVDVCTLVTAEDMGRVVGGQFNATPREGRAAGELYCNYKSTSDPKGPQQNISLLTQDAENTWKSTYNAHSNDTEHYVQLDIDGNQALFERQFSRLWTYKKGYTLIITIYVPNADGTGSDSDKALEMSKQLAQIALKKL